MVNLEQITQAGMLSIDSRQQFHPEMVSLAEQMMAEEFAEEINSGRVSIEDAYTNFWSHNSNNDKGPYLIPKWVPLVRQIAPGLSMPMSTKLSNFLVSRYELFEEQKNGEYNPFFSDLVLNAQILQCTEKDNEEIKRQLDPVIILGLANKGAVVEFITQGMQKGHMLSYGNIVPQKIGSEIISGDIIDSISPKILHPFLTKYMTNPHSRYKKKAADSLTRIMNEKDARSLIATMANPRNPNRLATLAAICTCELDIAVDYITTTLLDPVCDEGIRDVIFTNCESRNEKVGRAIVEYIRTTKKGDEKDALEALASSQTKTAYQEYAKILNDDNHPLQRLAIDAAGYSENYRLVELLKNYVVRKGQYRKEAIDSIFSIGGKAATDFLIGQLSERNLYHGEILKGLRRLNKDKAINTLIWYINESHGENNTIINRFNRKHAISALDELRPELVIKYRLWSVIEDGDTQKRYFQDMNIEESIRTIEAHPKNYSSNKVDEGTLRELCIDALQYCNEEFRTGFYLTDEERQRTVKEEPAKDPIDRIRSSLYDNQDKKDRQLLYDSIGEMEGFDLAITLLALGNDGTEEDISLIIDHYDQDYFPLKYSCVMALANIGSRKAISFLTDKLADPEIRYVAYAAIHMIEQEDKQKRLAA